MKNMSAIEMAMKLVGGKYKCLILYYLGGGRRRPRDLIYLLDGVNQKILTEQLRQLQADGLIEREAFAEIPPRVEYGLTEEGKTFLPVLQSLCDWGKAYDARHDNLVVPCSNTIQVVER